MKLTVGLIISFGLTLTLAQPLPAGDKAGSNNATSTAPAGSPSELQVNRIVKSGINYNRMPHSYEPSSHNYATPYPTSTCHGYAHGYYGNHNHQCRIFHVCQEDGRLETFDCPPFTRFNNYLLICDWPHKVDYNCDPIYKDDDYPPHTNNNAYSPDRSYSPTFLNLYPMPKPAYTPLPYYPEPVKALYPVHSHAKTYAKTVNYGAKNYYDYPVYQKVKLPVYEKYDNVYNYATEKPSYPVYDKVDYKPYPVDKSYAEYPVVKNYPAEKQDYPAEHYAHERSPYKVPYPVERYDAYPMEKPTYPIEKPAYEKPAYPMEKPAYVAEKAVYPMEKPAYGKPEYHKSHSLSLPYYPAYPETYDLTLYLVEKNHEVYPMEKPVYEKPAYEKPAYDKPAYEKPAYEKSAYEKPAYEKPVYEKPSYEKPVYDKPVYDKAAYPEKTLYPVQKPVYPVEKPAYVPTYVPEKPIVVPPTPAYNNEKYLYPVKKIFYPAEEKPVYPMEKPVDYTDKPLYNEKHVTYPAPVAHGVYSVHEKYPVKPEPEYKEDKSYVLPLFPYNTYAAEQPAQQYQYDAEKYNYNRSYDKYPTVSSYAGYLRNYLDRYEPQYGYSPVPYVSYRVKSHSKNY